MSIEKMKQWLEAVMRANAIDGMYSWQDEEDSLRKAISEAENKDSVIEIEFLEWAHPKFGVTPVQVEGGKPLILKAKIKETK